MEIFIARYVVNHDALHPIIRMIEIDEKIAGENPYTIVREKAAKLQKEGEFFLDLQYIGNIKERLIIKED